MHIASEEVAGQMAVGKLGLGFRVSRRARRANRKRTGRSRARITLTTEALGQQHDCSSRPNMAARPSAAESHGMFLKSSAVPPIASVRGRKLFVSGGPIAPLARCGLSDGVCFPRMCKSVRRPVATKGAKLPLVQGVSIVANCLVADVRP